MNAIRLWPVIFWLFLNACSTMKVDVDYDPRVNFKRLENYAWLSDKTPVTGNSIIDSDSMLHDRIRQDVDAWMQAHGYHITDKKSADFLLTYRIVMKDKTRVTVLDNYYNYPLFWRYGYYGYYGYPYGYPWTYYPEIQTYEYQRGTFVLDVIDPESKKLIWRGMVYQNMAIDISQQQLKEYVSKAVLTLLQRFDEIRG